MDLTKGLVRVLSNFSDDRVGEFRRWLLGSRIAADYSGRYGDGWDEAFAWVIDEFDERFGA